ncbi:MAG: NADPH-dependent 7-cyano-7-deazaguanine reductase QueF [Gemmatimonadaceae bacterium]|nr:NADPH-dependent 7-cyano-7-deazaguanine reductase QueF [Acetobacteraceae bacterium]
MTDYTVLTQLGAATPAPATPDDAVLERVANPQPGMAYVVRFTCPEFTSLCPMTGQPDFAHLVLDYVPGDWIVESKSLKLFLASFRNHGAFHEACTMDVARRVVDAVEPRWLRIGAYWYPRGGIPIDVFWQSGPAPDGVWLPDQGVAPYRGRG